MTFPYVCFPGLCFFFFFFSCLRCGFCLSLIQHPSPSRLRDPCPFSLCAGHRPSFLALPNRVIVSQIFASGFFFLYSSNRTQLVPSPHQIQCNFFFNMKLVLVIFFLHRTSRSSQPWSQMDFFDLLIRDHCCCRLCLLFFFFFRSIVTFSPGLTVYLQHQSAQTLFLVLQVRLVSKPVDAFLRMTLVWPQRLLP